MRNWIRSSMLALLLPVLPLSAQTPTKTDNENKSDSAEKKPETPPEKHFADVVKDAQILKGLFILYKTEDKVFLEILPDQFDKMYMLSLTCESGLGEGGFYGAEMCGETPISFHRQDKNVQLLARNTRFVAQPNSPMERAVHRSFSDSILGSAKIESLAHPERKSLLVDFGALLLTDLPMMGYALAESFRIPYRFDPKNRNVRLSSRVPSSPSFSGSITRFPSNTATPFAKVSCFGTKPSSELALERRLRSSSSPTTPTGIPPTCVTAPSAGSPAIPTLASRKGLRQSILSPVKSTMLTSASMQA